MEGQNTVSFVFIISVLFSTCGAASFYVMEDGETFRVKRETATTVNTNLVDGRDIAGVRDGSDILAKDTNPALSAIDGSDIVNKDLKADLKGVDGQDIAGIRDGTDIILSDTNQGLNAVRKLNDTQQEVTEVIPKVINLLPTNEGSEKTAVVENVKTIPEVINQAPINEAKEKPATVEKVEAMHDPSNHALITDGTEKTTTVIDNQDPNFLSTKTPDAQNSDIKTNPFLMAYFANQGNQQNNENSYHSNQGEHYATTSPNPESHETTPEPEQHETTTPDAEQHETTTPDSEQHETTTPDPDQPVQPSWRRGWYNPLFMTRPGELPPMALPMTAPRSGDKPVALALTSHGDKPEALALTSHSSENHRGQQQEQASSEQKPEQTGSTEGTYNAENTVHTYHGSSESSVVHDMPIALALTSHSEGQEHSAPVAMGKTLLNICKKS
jgi:hypothetical protein